MTVAEWLSTKFEEVEPMEFYREIFPCGSLEAAGVEEEGKYAGIVIERTGEKRLVQTPRGEKERELVRKYLVFDELDILDELQKTSDNFCIVAPISYAGRSRKSENARFMYALVIELDGLLVSEDGYFYGLQNLFAAMDEESHSGKGLYPRPTYVISSGSGVHLYYVFERPVPLFHNVAKSLEMYKHCLTKKIWNMRNTSLYNESDVQYESIYQPFRMVGTLTKSGLSKRKNGEPVEYSDMCRAYQTGARVSIAYMNCFSREYKQDNSIVEVYESKLTRKKAKELYPEWYEKKIVNGDKSKGHWSYNRALYESWKERIRNEAQGGHRYNCLLMLAINAKKCSEIGKWNNDPVTEEELEADCLELLEVFDRIEYVRKDGKRDRFTEDDVYAAIQAFYDEGVYTYPRGSMSYRSGIKLPVTKRNHREQNEHLEEARAIRDVRQNRKGTKWTDNSGRPSKEDAVRMWQMEHPDGTKTQCMKDTGLSKPTVLKWWVEFPHGEEK